MKNMNTTLKKVLTGAATFVLGTAIVSGFVFASNISSRLQEVATTLKDHGDRLEHHDQMLKNTFTKDEQALYERNHDDKVTLKTALLESAIAAARADAAAAAKAAQKSLELSRRNNDLLTKIHAQLIQAGAIK